jgi:hypothetical protein
MRDADSEILKSGKYKKLIVSQNIKFRNRSMTRKPNSLTKKQSI